MAGPVNFGYFFFLTVADLAGRNNVQPRRWGMMVEITDDGTPANNTTWILVKGLANTNINDNTNWQTLSDFIISIINTAAANEIPKSDGTNLVPSGLFSPAAGALRAHAQVGLGLSLRGYTATDDVPNGGLVELVATNAFAGGGGNGGSLYLASGVGDGAGTPGGIFINSGNNIIFFGAEGEQGTNNTELQVPNGTVGAEDGSDFSIIAGTARQAAGNGSGGDVRLQAGTRRVAGSGVDGSVILETNNGNGSIKINDGANEQMGASVLVAGTVVVNNTKVTANSRIFLTSQVDGGTPGFVRVSARVAGTSFTILSSNALDTSTIGWLILEPN
jgi:hypothetical protein